MISVKLNLPRSRCNIGRNPEIYEAHSIRTVVCYEKRGVSRFGYGIGNADQASSANTTMQSEFGCGF